LRELRARESLLQSSRMTTPLMLITSEQDPGFDDQMQLVNNLARYKRPHRLERFPGMPSGFMTASDLGAMPADWRDSQIKAWRELFAFIEERAPPNPEAPAEPEP
jgi:dipeptidyl aminopeptidase/acylaminoacyl peptidase